MKAKKMSGLLVKLSTMWYGENKEGVTPLDWNSTMDIVTEIEGKGFTILINNNSTGIFDHNDGHKMVGFTKDKDAEGRWESMISALVYLMETHSSFKD